MSQSEIEFRPVPGFRPIPTGSELEPKADFLGIGHFIEKRVGDVIHVVGEVVNFAGNALEDVAGYPVAFIKDPADFIQSKVADACKACSTYIVGGVVGVLDNVAREVGLTPLADGLRAFADVIGEVTTRFANLAKCGQYFTVPLFWAASSAIFALRVSRIVTTKESCKQFMGGAEFAKMLGGNIPVLGMADCAIETAFAIPLPAAAPPTPFPPGIIPLNGIKEKYSSLGGASGFLGAPQTEETLCPDNRGVYQHYEGGSIYWTPDTGAWEVHGDIRAKWASLGWETSLLGYPVTDETSTPDGVGRYSHFQRGSIYWTPGTGAWEVHGDIRAKWAELGWEKSSLGYPISDEIAMDNGTRHSNFQNGTIYWSANRGVWIAERGSWYW